MQAASHGAQFPMAQKVRASMSLKAMHDFAVGSEAKKPEHVGSKRVASSGSGLKKAPHANLGPYLHQKKVR